MYIVLSILVGLGLSIFLFLVTLKSTSSNTTNDHEKSGFLIAGPIGYVVDGILFTAMLGFTVRISSLFTDLRSDASFALFQVLIIVLAFKLARLIDARNLLATQPF